MDYSLFELAALSHVKKYQEIIDQLPPEQKVTYMNVAADIPISDFYLSVDEIRIDNNIAMNEEYKAKLNSLISDITFDLFAYCRETK